MTPCRASRFRATQIAIRPATRSRPTWPTTPVTSISPSSSNSRVNAIRRVDDAYVVELDDRTYEAEQVVIATGPFQVPFVPPIAEQLGEGVVQMHSTAYRSPQSVPEGRVLVVGGGNTGFQIAEELSASREVHLSIGSRQTPLPSGSWGATCSGTSRAPGSSARPWSRASDGGCRAATR